MPVEMIQEKWHYPIHPLVTDQIRNFKDSASFAEIAKAPVQIRFCSEENIKQGIMYHYDLKTKIIELPQFQQVEENEDQDSTEYIDDNELIKK